MSMDRLFDIIPLSCSDQEQNKSSGRQIRMVNKMDCGQFAKTDAY